MTKALFHTFLTIITGGLWLVFLLIRYMQKG